MLQTAPSLASSMLDRSIVLTGDGAWFSISLMSSVFVAGLEITGPLKPGYEAIFTPEACRFVADLVHEFEPRRIELLARRQQRQAEIDAGKLPDFLPETASIRNGDWKVAPVPPDLLDRRTEITGPVERKMAINALNSGAQCWMADFEDANSPTWENVVEGQINLRDAVNRNIRYTSPEGKIYAIGEKVATIVARPRGWHLDEKHVLLDGKRRTGAAGHSARHDSRHGVDRNHHGRVRGGGNFV